MTLRIVNVVATADLGQPVDLIRVSLLPDVVFDQEVYGGRVAYFKSSDTFGKVSVFFSGKLISVGSRSEGQAGHDLLLAHGLLASNGLIEKVELEPITRNIVATIALPASIDIEFFAAETDAIYEPEQFPAAIFKTQNPKTTYLVFSSGKIVITGVKSMDHLEKAAEDIIELAMKFS